MDRAVAAGRLNWLEYGSEAWALGIFMVSACPLAGGTLYRAESHGELRTWYRHELRPDGTLGPGTVIFGGRDEQGWRGLPELA